MSPGTGSDMCPGRGDPQPPELPGRCAACGVDIADRFYLSAVDRRWHVQCLRCHDCCRPLDTHVSCFSKDGSIYCREDYYRRFASKSCSGCQQSIAAQDLVMRARHLVYHLNCFTCAACHKTLITGEQYGMHDDHIFCCLHYQVELQGDHIHGSLTPEFQFNEQLATQQMPIYAGVGLTGKGRHRKRKLHTTEYDMDQCGPHIGLTGAERDMLALCGPDSLVLQSGRQKRMRTSFKHHQLRIMKSYFQLNHNPDAKDLKQLAQKTGLSKRVLQVWFQNARAKYRRNILKQDGDKGQSSSPGVSSEMNLDDASENNNNNNKNSVDDLSSAPSPSYSDNSASEHGSGYVEYEHGLTHDYTMDNNSALDLDHGSSEPTGLSEIFRSSYNTMS